MILSNEDIAVAAWHIKKFIALTHDILFHVHESIKRKTERKRNALAEMKLAGKCNIHSLRESESKSNGNVFEKKKISRNLDDSQFSA